MREMSNIECRVEGGGGRGVYFNMRRFIALIAHTSRVRIKSQLSLLPEHTQCQQQHQRQQQQTPHCIVDVHVISWAKLHVARCRQAASGKSRLALMRARHAIAQ